jgi:hypothetical protein
MQINVDNEEVFAMINYARDVAMGCDPGPWDDIKAVYMEEAIDEECQDSYVLTLEEAKVMFESFLK